MNFTSKCQVQSRKDRALCRHGRRGDTPARRRTDTVSSTIYVVQKNNGITWVPRGGRAWEGSLGEGDLGQKGTACRKGFGGRTLEKNTRPISVMGGGAEAEGADTGLSGPWGLSSGPPAPPLCPVAGGASLSTLSPSFHLILQAARIYLMDTTAPQLMDTAARIYLMDSPMPGTIRVRRLKEPRFCLQEWRLWPWGQGLP